MAAADCSGCGRSVNHGARRRPSARLSPFSRFFGSARGDGPLQTFRGTRGTGWPRGRWRTLPRDTHTDSPKFMHWGGGGPPDEVRQINPDAIRRSAARRSSRSSLAPASPAPPPSVPPHRRRSRASVGPPASTAASASLAGWSMARPSATATAAVGSAPAPLGARGLAQPGPSRRAADPCALVCGG
jgi:hypothetical protein